MTELNHDDVMSVTAVGKAGKLMIIKTQTHTHTNCIKVSVWSYCAY